MVDQLATAVSKILSQEWPGSNSDDQSFRRDLSMKGAKMLGSHERALPFVPSQARQPASSRRLPPVIPDAQLAGRNLNSCPA